MTTPLQKSHEEMQKEIVGLKRQLNRYEEGGEIDLAFTQQVLANTAKASSSLVEMKDLMERVGRDNTACFGHLKMAIKAIKEVKASVTPAMLLKRN